MLSAGQQDLDDVETRARTGDARAFGALIRAVDHDLRGVVWSVVRSGDATDDVMQAAYEKAFRSLGSFDQRSSLRTWLHSICYRTAIDHLRHEALRRHDELASVSNRASPTWTDSEALDRVELDELLGRLDPDQRAMVMLILGLGYSYDDAAVIVGRPRGTVASTINRVRVGLRRWEET